MPKLIHRIGIRGHPVEEVIQTFDPTVGGDQRTPPLFGALSPQPLPTSPSYRPLFEKMQQTTS